MNDNDSHAASHSMHGQMVPAQEGIVFYKLVVRTSFQILFQVNNSEKRTVTSLSAPQRGPRLSKLAGASFPLSCKYPVNARTNRGTDSNAFPISRTR